MEKARRPQVVQPWKAGQTPNNKANNVTAVRPMGQMPAHSVPHTLPRTMPRTSKHR